MCVAQPSRAQYGLIEFSQLCEGIKVQIRESDTIEVDILAWMGRTALELIGQGGFGRSFDPLTTTAPNAYADAVKQLVCVPLFHDNGVI